MIKGFWAGFQCRAGIPRLCGWLARAGMDVVQEGCTPVFPVGKLHQTAAPVSLIVFLASNGADVCHDDGHCIGEWFVD